MADKIIDAFKAHPWAFVIGLAVVGAVAFKLFS